MKAFNLDEALAGKPVITECGYPVKIAGYNPDANSYDKIAGWMNGGVYNWSKDGEYSHNDPYNLFMALTTRKEWIVRTPVLVDMLVNGNHYSNNIFGPYDNYEIAMKTADSLKGSIHEITITE
jgi:hypothetical protein